MNAPTWPGDWHVLGPPVRDQRLNRAPVGLQRGDVLLRCPVQPDRTQRGIAQVQGQVYAPHHACFVHVGLYVGDHQVVDATPAHGVACRSTRDFFGDAWVRVRRLAGVSAARRAAMATSARAWAQQGSAYSHLQVAADAVAGLADPALAQRWLPVLRALQRASRARSAARHGQPSAYCGGLVDDLSAACAFRSIVDDQTCFAPLPAAFSADLLQYENVAARW